ncbi:aminotransferase class IV [Streptomyces fuscichromogenes]|uniref:aminotransferase class IV n=1 Tax=Streptomyces fuscichromogenes TaxID=1324013 RepID=UPI00381626F1
MTQPAVTEGVLAWSPHAGLRPAEDAGAGEPLLVADSWLVRDGRVRGLARHRERFVRSCGECDGPPAYRLLEFWRDMTAALPRTGEWFPRVELTPHHVRLRLRHAPPLGSAVEVWAVGRPDPRAVPRRKGPDLDALARLRARAVEAGAQEVILVGPAGVVLEGATTSVLWWEGDTLCLPPPRLPVLPGVTQALVQERAERLGIGVAHRERTLADLADREVWLVNALHGLRPVTRWVGGPAQAGRAVRAPEWQEWLDEKAPEPIAPL